MKLSDIIDILTSIGIPVAYNHFVSRQEPPYLVYYVENSDNFCADNKVMSENLTVMIELYTKTKNLQLEKQLKDLLTDNEFPYELIGESFIESDNVYQIMYEINVMAVQDESPLSI